MQARKLVMGAACLLAMFATACASENSDDESNGGAGTSGDGDGDGDSNADSGSAEPNVDAGVGGDGDGDADAFPDPRNGCPDLDTGYPGDDTCIAPPAPGEGFQIHIGPSTYDEAGVAPYLFEPGSESSECWVFHTPNDEEVYYQSFVLSGRPGTHHIINTMYISERAEGGFVMCRDGGTGANSDIIDNLPGASKAYMPRGTVAPENEHVGRVVPANASAEADMHYFNFTQEPILREFWMNVYTVPKSQITEEAQQIRGMGGISWNFLPIQPGTDEVYQYECAIESDGRITALLGHYHAHGRRFTSHLRRANGERIKVFEMYDYNDPQQFEYNTVVENPAFSETSAGAFTGTLDVQAGDVLEWECHIVNDDNVPLRYVNQVQTGEMCNLWGSSVGPNVNCVLP